MFNSNADLINANNRAITALNQCLARLNRLTIGALPSENADLQADISETTSQINLLNISNAHLAAATVAFQPLDPDSMGELVNAFHRIDQAIIQNQIINAGIDTISDVIGAAAKIRSITDAA